MDIVKKIEADLISALRGGDSQRVSVLRMVKSAFKNKEIEKRGLPAQAGKGNFAKGAGEILTGDEVISILNREVKKRKEAIALFTKGNRGDLVQKEERELKTIEEYLPQAMSNDEIEAVVNIVLKGKNYGLKDLRDNIASMCFCVVVV